MAKTVVTTDDLDGSSAAETVAFSYGGRGYEVDLSKKNRAAFEKAIQPYIEAARSTSGRVRGGSASSTGRRGGGVSLSDVRSWAGANGINVSARGRISKAVMDQYRAAH